MIQLNFNFFVNSLPMPLSLWTGLRESMTLWFSLSFHENLSSPDVWAAVHGGKGLTSLPLSLLPELWTH